MLIGYRCAGQQVVHLIVSRTATGSSCRFVAAFAVAFLQLTQSSMRPRAASGLLSELTENLSFSSAWGSRGSLPAGSLPSSPLGSPRRWWGGLGSRRNVSSCGSVDSAAGPEDDGSLVERYVHAVWLHARLRGTTDRGNVLLTHQVSDHMDMTLVMLFLC